MARHPWVAAADAGVHFGVEVMGIRGFTDPGPGDGLGGVLLYDEPLQVMLDAARVVEELGFDAVFVPETPRSVPDPIVSLTALALTTSRVWIGSSVIVPAFRHPALLARQIADVDRLSGGRVIVGLGIGESEGQYRTVGAAWGSATARRDALGEAIEVMTGAWGADSFTYHGRHHHTEHMRIIPGPLQRPRPPILVGGSGDRTLEQAAHLADACNLLFSPVEEVRSRIDYLDQCCDAIGRPRNEVLRSYWGLLSIETPEQAIAHYQALIDAGIQYFIVATPDTADHESLRLLATEVIPHLAV